MTPARAITPAEATAAAQAGEIVLWASWPIAPTVDQAQAITSEQLQQAAALAGSLSRATGGAIVGQLPSSTGAILSGAGMLGGVTGAVPSGSPSPNPGDGVNRTLNGALPAINLNKLGL